MNTTEVKKSLKEIEDTLNDVYCDIQSIRAAADNIHLMLKIVNQQLGEIEPKKSYIDVVLKQEDEMSYEEIAKDYGFKPTELISNLIDECGWICVNLFCDKKYRLEIYYALKAKGILPLMERGDNA